MSETEPRPDRVSDAIAGTRTRAGRAYRRADAIVAGGERRAFRVLWFFLPEPKILRSVRFKHLLASIFLADAARDGLRYGALISITASTGSAFQSSLVGVASVLPPALFGLYGGAVADALPKRIALGAIYVLDGLVCFIVPTLFGTGLVAMLFLVFSVNLLGLVSGPTEQSITPLVASESQLASANALSSLSSNLGTAFGTALMAPILVKLWGVRPVFFVSGAMLVFASARILQVRSPRDLPKVQWKRPHVSLRETFAWLVDQPAVTAVIVVFVLAGTGNLVLTTLAPGYVQSVLHLDPANAVYVFAPTSVGLALALFLAPKLMRLIGERLVALSGLFISAACLSLLGLVGHGLPHVVDPVNPLRLLSDFGIRMGPPVRTAALLALPIGFGIALTSIAVQTYINRRVPLALQARTFAIQSVMKNATAIVPLLTLGAAASAIGVGPILLAMPLVLLLAGNALIGLSFRFAGRQRPSELKVFESFWEEPRTAVAPG
jgi:MFS family permease